MKNTSTMMLGIVEGIFKDISSTFPSMVTETRTCLQVLESAVSSRGLPFLTITLPECAKFLELALEEGRIPDSRPPYHSRYRNDDCRPVFLHSLWSAIFDDHGVVLDNADPFAIASLRQVYLFAKKWKSECKAEYVDQAVQDYIFLETQVLPASRPDTWDSDVPSWGRPSGHPLWGDVWGSTEARQLRLDLAVDLPETTIKRSEWKVFRELCSRLTSSFGFLDVWAIDPKHGPGAVSDKVRGVVKYDFKNWPRKLEAVFPSDYFASHDFVSRVVDLKEYPCKLIAVPKTQKGPRLIASEPTAHQWVQGGLQRWLERAVKRSPLSLSIDFRDQSASQALALEASFSGDYATVDLSAASDRLCTRLVDYCFQANTSILDALHACRSRAVHIPKALAGWTDNGRTLMLRKFAAMGSAVTFPIQTIVFTMIGHFALCLADGSRDVSLQALRARAHRIRVFGDDIIIDSKAYGHLVRILTDVGLKVNEGKSHSRGLFREACGMDAYSGVDVTPAYLRTIHEPSNPESLASVIECANNFYKRGWWHASDAVLKTVDSEILKEVAVLSEGLSSISLFTFVKGSLFIPSTRRWNRKLHRHEYMTLSLVQQTKKDHGSGEASLLQYFTEDPASADLWNDNEPLADWSTGQARRPTLQIKRRWAVLPQ